MCRSSPPAIKREPTIFKKHRKTPTLIFFCNILDVSNSNHPLYQKKSPATKYISSTRDGYSLIIRHSLHVEEPSQEEFFFTSTIFSMLIQTAPISFDVKAMTLAPWHSTTLQFHSIQTNKKHLHHFQLVRQQLPSHDPEQCLPKMQLSLWQI